MSAGVPQLTGATRNCKVNTGWASRIESDRFLNSQEMMCPAWSGYDTAGRAVCANSFVHTRAGCSPASYRITVENALRPQYAEFINLDAGGFQSPALYSDSLPYQQEGLRQQNLNNVNNLTGNFGTQFGSKLNTYTACCKTGGHDAAMSQMQRAGQYNTLSAGVQARQQCGGMQ